MGLESQSITLAKFVQRELVRTWRVDISREELEAIIDSMSNSAINPLEVILDYLQTKLEYLRVELISQTSASLLIQGADTLNQTFFYRQMSNLNKLHSINYKHVIKTSLVNQISI